MHFHGAPVAVATIAVFGSMRAGSICVPPQPGQMQRPHSGRPMSHGFSPSAGSVPTSASQCIASSSPPPSAALWITATVGTPSAGMAANAAAPRSRYTCRPASSSASISARSAPATKTRVLAEASTKPVHPSRAMAAQASAIAPISHASSTTTPPRGFAGFGSSQSVTMPSASRSVRSGWDMGGA